MPSCPIKTRTSRATQERTFFRWVHAGGIVLASTLGCATLSIGQEPTPKQSSAAPTARPTSDALKFANGLLRQRKFELAAEEYERILGAGAAGAERDEALFGLGTARLSIGRYREAREAFDAFLEGCSQRSQGTLGAIPAG